MARPQKHPLRELTEEERGWLERLRRAPSQPADQVARARELLAVAAGQTFTAAARAAGRRSGDAVAHLVVRFNAKGLDALAAGHGGGSAPQYGPAERERILAEFRRVPDRERDGTASWSMATLRRALQVAPNGLSAVSIDTIWKVLREAGYSWQRDRTWCATGTVRRKRKRGVVTVVDPDSAPKKS